MRKNELIEKLQAIEGNPVVAIWDIEQDARFDNGVFKDFGVDLIKLEADEMEFFKEENDGKDFVPWIAISFTNEIFD